MVPVLKKIQTKQIKKTLSDTLIRHTHVDNHRNSFSAIVPTETDRDWHAEHAGWQTGRHSDRWRLYNDAQENSRMEVRKTSIRLPGLFLTPLTYAAGRNVILIRVHCLLYVIIYQGCVRANQGCTLWKKFKRKKRNDSLNTTIMFCSAKFKTTLEKH